jgi:hypothetical protein
VKDNKQIAIIFFSRKAKKEAKFKKFIASTDAINENLSATLISSTQKELQSTQIPIFHYHEENQVGNTFGEKLANAYQEVFDQGYQAVISVGNDSPEINQINWVNITEKLQKGENILGPNLRGGAYLIGLTKSQFQKSAFASLPWQSNKLFKTLVYYCESNAVSTIILDKLRDINTIHDLKLFLKNSASFKNIFQLVKLILSSKVLKNLKQIINFQSLVALPGLPFRGPPHFS